LTATGGGVYASLQRVLLPQQEVLEDSMIVTVELLESLDACKNQVELFKKFLDGKLGLELSPSNALRAKEFGLDVRWLIGKADFPREVALLDPYLAYSYALHVDKAPRDETREVACKNPKWAYNYAVHVDKVPRNDTREAACQDPYWAYSYARDVDKAPRDETREESCKDPYCAYYYAQDVDEAPRDDTREAVCEDPKWRTRYIQYFGGR